MKRICIGLLSGVTVKVILVSLTVLACSTGFAQQAKMDGLKQDLHTALILEGHYCGDIVALTQTNDSDYTVRCKNGKRYRIYISEEGDVEIEHSADVVKQVENDHVSQVKRQLYTIIALSGKMCEKVLEYNKIEPHTHIATCKNGKQYQVRVTSEGWVLIHE
ncbi:MAG: hypothetical protein ACR2QW_20115 [bacterium]